MIYDKNTTDSFIKNQINTTSYDSIKNETPDVFSLSFFNKGLLSGDVNKIFIEWINSTEILDISHAFLKFFTEEDFHANITNITTIKITNKFWNRDILNFSDLIPMNVTLTDKNCTLESLNATNVTARSYFKLFLLLNPRKPANYRNMSFEIQILNEFHNKIKGFE